MDDCVAGTSNVASEGGCGEYGITEYFYNECNIPQDSYMKAFFT